MNSLAHIEINVSNLESSKKFYSSILLYLKWVTSLDSKDCVGFKGPDKTSLFLVQTETEFSSTQFHRKNVGLNHIAFRVNSKEEVNLFCDFLKLNSIPTLYTDGAKDYSLEYGMEEYFSVFFEDPDRIKLEVVFVR
ncbi:MAG: VOC family protein [Candidatus Pacebacteria bacterium]|nr:VOC family protein [Candidatus Paceibacterota bacterium]